MSEHKELKFGLLEKVRIIASGEEGEVIARYEFYNAEPAYRLRYENKLGVAVERGWAESTLSKA